MNTEKPLTYAERKILKLFNDFGVFGEEKESYMGGSATQQEFRFDRAIKALKSLYEKNDRGYSWEKFLIDFR